MQPDSGGIVEFLRAWLDDRHARASKLLRYAQENDVAVRDPRLLGRTIPGWHEWPEVEQMAREALADVAAQQQVVEHAQRWQDTLHATPEGWTADTATAYRMAMDWTLCLLALPFADHPDYDEAWDPLVDAGGPGPLAK